MAIELKPDKKIQEIAKQCSEVAVSYVFDNYNIKLDYSEKTIADVEAILDSMHKEFLTTNWNDDQIFSRAQCYGSYIGEVYRRNHGAEWGRVNFDGEKFEGLESQENGRIFWPWGKAYNRIKNGEEDNISFYYYILNQGEK